MYENYILKISNSRGTDWPKWNSLDYESNKDTREYRKVSTIGDKFYSLYSPLFLKIHIVVHFSCKCLENIFRRLFF